MNSTSRIELHGFPLDVGLAAADLLEQLAAGPLLLTYLNPRAWHVAKKYPDYPDLLRQFDRVVCDGIAVQWAAKGIIGYATPIVTPDNSGIGRGLLCQLAASQRTLCLVGGTPAVSRQAHDHLINRWPELVIDGVFPGYGDALEQARQHIMDAQPDFVMVAMGMYLQERFSVDMRRAGARGSFVCVGGFFDKLADPAKDYSPWQVRLKLRFLAHLRNDPVRYLWRYLVEYQRFFWRLIRDRIKK